MAYCPAHDDDRPSLSVKLDGDRILLHCFAGCLPERIVSALGLEMRDLFLDKAIPRLEKREHDAHETVWVIRDPDGNPVAEHVRVDTPDGKRFYWRRNGKPGLGGLRTSELPLYGVERLRNLPDGVTVVVCEGEKARDAIRQAGLYAVGTVTGASTVPDRSVLESLRRFRVVLWPDNDPQGREHMRRIARELLALGVTPLWVEWPGAPPKADAADADPDLIRRLVKGAKLYAPESPLSEARKAVQKWLALPDLDVVDLILATVAANASEGEPVWLLLVGPPSSAKSELLRAVADLPQCFRIASLTGRTLISGHKDAKGGLLFRIPDRSTVVLLDFGQVLSLHPNDKALVLQRLREIYDGYTKADFGNRTDGLEWRGKLGFLAGVTPAIEKYTSVGAELGDRFLLYRMDVPHRQGQAKGAIANTGTEKTMREELASAFRAALEAAGDPASVEIPEGIAEKLAILADVTTRLRTPVARDRYTKDIEYIPVPEAPARFAKALALLAKALAALRGKPRVTEEELPVLARIAVACIPSRRLAILNALTTVGEGSTRTIALAANMATSSARLILEDLMYLGAVNRRAENENDAFLWSLKPKIHEEVNLLRGVVTQKQQESVESVENIRREREKSSSVVFACKAPAPAEGPLTAPSGDRIDLDDPSTWSRCPVCGVLGPWRGVCPNCRGTRAGEREGTVLHSKKHFYI